MADDNNSRHRSSDAFDQEPTSPGGPRRDPLAELARMIGERDPFSEYSRRFHAQGASGPRVEPVPGYDTDPTPGYGDLRDGGLPVIAKPAESFDIDPAPRFGHEPGRDASGGAALRYGGQDSLMRSHDYPASAEWPNTSAAASSYSTDSCVPDSFVAPQDQPNPNEHHDDSGLYADSHHQPAIDDSRSDQLALDRAAYQLPPDDADMVPPLYPYDPGAGSIAPPHGNEFYHDTPKTSRRKGLLTVVAVLGLAVVGTAGAFGYRSFFHGATTSSPPPVIRASGEPSKIAAPPSNADSPVVKFSYDRFGDRDQNERLVERQEAPVEPQDIARTSVPRAVLLGAPINSGPSSVASSLGGTATTANPPSVLGEPRRVRTVPIRPDRPDPAANPQVVESQTKPAPAVSVAPLSRSTNMAATAPANPPLQVAPEPMEAAPRPAPSRAASSRPAARSASRPTPIPSPEPSANAPLSLSPDRVAQSPPNARAAAPLRTTSPPTRLASTPSAKGGYVVQVSSRRTEGEAEAAFRSLQARYSSVLGGHPHIIKRADLGSRGVYYRAMVGPFGSRHEAAELCGDLKAAGGDCIVQSN
jgi:hypothetical protein